MPEYDFDPETGQYRQNLGFEEKSRRMAFVRKVLGTVTLQLFFCFAITASCLFSGESGKKWIFDHWWIAFIGLIVFFIIQCMVVCCGVGMGPPNPCNITLVIIATIALSVFCAFVTVAYSAETVMYALACTVLVLIIVVVITVCTPIDITGWGLMLCCAGIALMLVSLMVTLVLILSQPDRETKRIILLVLLALFIFSSLLCTFCTIFNLSSGGKEESISLARENGFLQAYVYLGTLCIYF